MTTTKMDPRAVAQCALASITGDVPLAIAVCEELARLSGASYDATLGGPRWTPAVRVRPENIPFLHKHKMLRTFIVEQLAAQLKGHVRFGRPSARVDEAHGEVWFHFSMTAEAAEQP